jgi:hypothetical protein
MTFDVKICGVAARLPHIQKTMQVLNLSEEDVFLDDRPNGGSAFYVTRKALLAPRNENITHRVLLQDDVELCNNFTDIVRQIIETHPDKIVALFTTDSYVKPLIHKLQGTPYIQNNSAVSGAGFIFPVKYTESYLFWCQGYNNENIAEDVAMFSWAGVKKIPILNTVPSLIQHIGDESVLLKDAPIRRTKYFQENPVANWESKIIK